MTVLYICSSISLPHRAGLGLGGSTHTLEVAQHLAQAGMGCVVVCARDSEEGAGNLTLNGITVLPMFGETWIKRQLKRVWAAWRVARVPYHLLHSLRMAAKLRAVVRRYRVSVVYERASHASLAGLMVAQLMNLPYVLEVNDGDVNRLALWRCQGIVTPCKEVLPLRYQGKVTELAWGVNTRLFHPGVAAAKLAGRVVVFVGSGMQWHGLDAIIECAQSVSQRVPDVHFVLVGGQGAGLEKAKARVAALGLDGVCTLTGFVPYEEVPAYINAAEIALAPYTGALAVDGRNRFASPMKVLEYFACRKPVIVTAVANHNQLVKDGQTGVVVPDDQPEALAEAIEYLLDHREEGVRMGRNAFAVAAEKFSWAAHCRALGALFEKAGIRG